MLVKRKKDVRRGTPPLKKIHEHWLKKVVDDPQHWARTLGDYQIENIHVGEGLACYACGIEEEGGLERAHIVPHSLGGSCEADNLFLLCSYCHKENPDTIYRDMFFHYIKNRDSHMFRWWKLFYLPVKHICDSATPEEQEIFMNATLVPEGGKKVMAEYKAAVMRDATIAGGVMSLETQRSILWKTFLKVGAEASCHTELAA